MDERKEDEPPMVSADPRELLKQKAVELFTVKGLSKIDISVELGISRPTLNKWLKELGVTTSTPHVMVPVKDKVIGEKLDEFLDAALQGQLPNIKYQPEDRASPEEVSDARIQERADLATSAESNMTPADRYAAYTAAQGIRIMRDAFPSIRTPTTVKELEILDSIIRRNLGLDKRGGQGSLKIDLNILNNSKASPKGAVIDIKQED
jgi:hypothetical protein